MSLHHMSCLASINSITFNNATKSPFRKTERTLKQWSHILVLLDPD